MVLRSQARAQIDEINAQLQFGDEGSFQSQTLPIVVNLPGLASAAAAIVADLHGRMGHFPHIIRMRPSAQDRTVYEIAEIVELQTLRDAALQEVRV